jgi:type IV pilus assembly protein PilO
MKLLFSSKEKVVLGSVIVVLILYLVLLQFYFLSPLKSDLQSKQQMLVSEQKVLESMQKKSGNNETADANTTELQKEVPVKPLQDQFILDLQQAEAVSNSLIKSMSFTEGGQATAASTQPAATSTTTQSQSSGSTSQSSTTTQSQSNPGTTSQSNTSSSSPNTSQQQTAQTTSSTTSGTASQQNTNTAQTTGTPAVSKLTVQLSIQSQRYQDLEKFINTIEGLKRITFVEAINYTGNKEITSLIQDNKPLDYTLTISAYYLPGLTDLDKQLPKVDFPAPANKDNPLSQFANTQTP